MFPRTGVVSQLLRSSAGSASAQQRIVPGAGIRRCFSNSRALKQAADASSLPAKKPVGAFRGGVLGFLTGSVAAGAAVYYFILGEYRYSNEMLSEDISLYDPSSSMTDDRSCVISPGANKTNAESHY